MRRILRFIRQCDLWMLLLCLAASLYGVILIYSATRFKSTYHTLPLKQGIAIALGVVIYFLCSAFDPQRFIQSRIFWFALDTLVLLSLIPFGTGYQGNKNWLELSWLPFSIMPAEPVKLPFVFLLSGALSRTEKPKLPQLLAAGGIAMWFCALIFLISGDAGSALVYGVIFVLMCWCAGVAKGWFVLGGSLVGIAGFALWNYLPEDNYWLMRIRVVLNHDLDPLHRGWNQIRSVLAIRSGGISGSGFLRGILTQMPEKNALPERYTDFIFSVCAEEFGLIGCCVLLLLLCAIILRCFLLAKQAQDPALSLVCVGFGSMLLFQTALNVGMCLFVAPVVGITLPFISYGGSSILTLFAAMGIVSGVYRNSRQGLFY